MEFLVGNTVNTYFSLIFMLLLQDFCVPLAVEKLKHQMALEGVFEKANKLYTVQGTF